MRYALMLLMLGCATADEDFRDISRHPANDHNCDDMSQEWRDVLVNRGVSVDNIRLVQGYKDGLVHMWLEVREWVMYDPWMRLYHAKPHKDFKTMPMSGYSVFRDGGYLNRGDRYIKGKWRR